MNRLSGSQRAITAPVAGTTRDVLSAAVRLGKVDAVLLDAAGIDHSPDEVIAAARSMARRTAVSVDLICVVLDAAAMLQAAAAGTGMARSAIQKILGPLELNADDHYVVALNKCDLCSPEAVDELVDETQHCCGRTVVAVSALTGAGIDDLREALAAGLGDCAASVMGEAAVFSGRQKEALELARESLRKAAALAESSQTTSQSADLLAFELREALNALGTVTGEVTTEDLLTQIFANFCIGK
jgi:tRNA modification GTPase